MHGMISLYEQKVVQSHAERKRYRVYLGKLSQRQAPHIMDSNQAVLPPYSEDQPRHMLLIGCYLL